ncbi:15209_t:CDS:2 [Racocetra fulgida]|uniref:15209_t:CDS:1 n=1 Tax=Racocetra fulgida TaxID=60492 RepID=A0A9N8ZBK2_9GLOM|nr:15209_t:CDS:2 [Racocetra fulgida]
MTLMERYAEIKDKKLSYRWKKQYENIKLFKETYSDTKNLDKLHKKEYARLLTNALQDTLKNWVKKKNSKLFDTKTWNECNRLLCAIGKVIAELLPDCFSFENLTVEQLQEVELFLKYILDVSQYDKKQGMPTQMLEDILIDLFFSNKIMRLYREMRCSMKMDGEFVKFVKTGVKDSGENPNLSLVMNADYDFPKYGDFASQIITPWETMPKNDQGPNKLLVSVQRPVGASLY